MKKYHLVSLLWLISTVSGQNLVDLRTQTKNVDFSNAASTIPAKSGTALPATCNAGEMFFKTNNTAGQNLYGCDPANSWTLLSGAASSGTVSPATSGQFGFYSVSGSTIVGHSLVASDIPALSYQTPLTFSGNGAKTASSTGAFIGNDCAKWDANGNITDSGAPCASVSIGTGTVGQFGFYSSNGSALTAHTLATSDIPALNYQSPLTFTGNGAKTASSTGTLTGNDCAKWDANGNIIDSGAPCASASIGAGTTGQFGFYAANGAILAAHTLVAGDIPALSYQAPLSFTGNGAKTASSTGTLTGNDCAKWDANGNIIDSGAPCASASIGTGTTGQFGFYAANGAVLAAHTLVAGDIPTLNYQAPLSFTGNGAKTASSTGVVAANDCAKWDASGNIIDSGAPCASGSGGLSAPSSTTVGNIPQYNNTTGTTLSAGLGVVTSVGSPGLDTNIATEKAIRTAINAVTTGSGNLPPQTGSAGYLVTNGTTASWGNIVTGGSGALDCATIPGVCDIVTAIVPLKPSANAWSGVNKFSQLQVNVYSVAALPSCNASFEGQVEGVTDAASPSYLTPVTGGGSSHVPVYCNGTAWVAH